MDANRFFSIPYDATHDFKIRRLMKAEGGIIAYGRWVALLGMLYDEHGMIDLNDPLACSVVFDELELEDFSFFDSLAQIGLIDQSLYESANHVINAGVCEQLDYYKAKSEAGKKGMKARWAKKDDADSTC